MAEVPKYKAQALHAACSNLHICRLDTMHGHKTLKFMHKPDDARPLQQYMPAGPGRALLNPAQTAAAIAGLVHHAFAQPHSLTRYNLARFGHCGSRWKEGRRAQHGTERLPDSCAKLDA